MKKILLALAAMLSLTAVASPALAGYYGVARTGCKVEGEARWAPCVRVSIDGKTYFRDYGNANFDPKKAVAAAKAEFGNYNFHPELEHGGTYIDQNDVERHEGGSW